MPGGFENFTSTSFYLPVSDTGTFVAQKARFQFTCPSKTQRCMRSAIHLTSSLRVVPSNLQLWLISSQFLAAKKLVNLTTGLGLHGSPSDHHVQTSTLGTPKLLLWSIDEMQSDAWKAKMFITCFGLRRLSMKLRSALNKLQQYFYSKTWESILCKKHCIEHARSQFSRLVRRDGFQRRSHSLGKVHQHLPGSWLASCWSSLQLRHR